LWQYNKSHGLGVIDALLAAFVKLKNFVLVTSNEYYAIVFACESALANLVNKWTETIDKGLLNGVILLDLRKAFDLIDHQILLQKLKMYKCSTQALNWFGSYLQERTQCTSFKGCTSETRNITVGVPQGSILGPLFFILFINDLPLFIQHSVIDMYADDSTITSSARSVPDLNDKLNADLESVSAWCSMNRMAANSSKTKSMLVTTWQKRNSLPDDCKTLSVYLQNQLLQDATTEKLLGVQINHNLSWEEHIHYIERTINKKLALLRRIKCYLPIHTRKLFFNAHVLPHMDYCSVIWGSSSFVHRLLLVQKRAARSVLDIADYEHPSADMFKQLKWMPIQSRINYRKATMVYKCLNNLAPSYMCDMFKFVKDVNSRQTRSAVRDDLYLPGGRHKDVYINSFAYSGALLWNKLPLDIRNKSSLDSFKHAFVKNYYNVLAQT